MPRIITLPLNVYEVHIARCHYPLNVLAKDEAEAITVAEQYAIRRKKGMLGRNYKSYKDKCRTKL